MQLLQKILSLQKGNARSSPYFAKRRKADREWNERDKGTEGKLLIRTEKNASAPFV